MKERPILFSAPMVRAILEGRKTQTRRVMKPQPEVVPHDHNEPGHWWPSKAHQTMVHVENALQNKSGIWGGLAGDACPHGNVGDRLWVREAWRVSSAQDKIKPINLPEDLTVEYSAGFSADNLTGKRRSSIHMPRWASRINLEITGIRVERLQDISEADAIAEGAQRFDDIPVGTPRPYRINGPDRWSMENPPNTDHCLSTARYAFANFFEKTSSQGSWDKNPWVWVVEFKRVDQKAEQDDIEQMAASLAEVEI